ncbi:hypothetical protein [Bradyrhizobium diversitatis]|uniref:Uncharacterized protein n=1 Tax=Bradyrhizobium diversitatis TaxID=2755406 RepID=A0ABS0PG48_9BRAD|nr:hypothetical protein [Bradyrhizobium diversitatis]MBH5392183.1 hypothetical protein [Bradyrhizobium diversitatis]
MQEEEQQARQCLFATAPGHKPARSSGEHLFPKWMRKHLKLDLRQNSHEQVLGRPGQPGYEIRRRTGLTIHRKINCACRSCNSGWMNRIENEAQPVLTALIAGKALPLDAAKQLAIAKWVTLKTIVGDQDHLETTAISARECEQFFATAMPLDNWQIFIGLYEGTEWNARFDHFPYVLNASQQPSHDRRYNTQSTAICFGRVFVLSCSSIFPFLFEIKGMERLWPPTAGTVTLSTATINDGNALATAKIIEEVVGVAASRNTAVAKK